MVEGTTTQITYQELLDSFHQFLLVLTHSILFYREVYPDDSFELVQFYDIAVHQSRHPEVCEWIQEMVGSCIENMDCVCLS